MNRLIDALSGTNKVLLVITLATIAAAGYTWWREWSDAAAAADDEIEREYRQLLEAHGRQS